MSQVAANDDRKLCANPICVAPLEPDSARCPQCAEVILYCYKCGATARALARFCRWCATPLNTDWACEHTQLKHLARSPIIENETYRMQLQWQLALGTELIAAPLAARGIIVIALSNGRILLLDEKDGALRQELQVGEAIIFTPVLVDNLLIVATSNRIIAFDLIAAIYGNMAKGDMLAWQSPLATGEQVCSPLLANTTMVIAVIKQPTQAQIITIDKHSGQRLATISLAGRSSRTTHPYLSAENELFIATKDGTVMLVDLSRGGVVNTARAGCEIDTNVFPAGRADSLFFVRTDGQLWRAAKAQTELQLQPFGDTSGFIINALAATEKYLAVAHGSGLVLYDPFGTLLWETTLDSNSLTTTPLLDNHFAWVIDDAGMLFFFNLLISVPRLRQRIFEHIIALPAILTPEQIIFSSRAGQVKAYSWR